MIKKLQPIGNSVGVILDRALLDSIGLARDSLVDISTDGRVLTIRPAEKRDHKTRVKESAARMSRIHHETFKKLAQ